MKKILVAAILGIAMSAKVFAQGAIAFDPYATIPYNQVFWNNTVAGTSVAGQAAQNANLQIQLWYGKGNIVDANLLTLGVTTSISFDAAKAAYTPDGGTHGPGGYFTAFTQNLPTWAAGDTFTFQLRASGSQGTDTFTGSSVLFTQQGQIRSSDLPALFSNVVPGLGVTVVPVPEPSTFALAGLGSAALLIFRRRK